MSKTYDQVKEYYGKVLEKSKDLKTNACCTFENIPDFPFEPHYIEIDDIRIHYVDELLRVQLQADHGR